jgi:hypothetical protein
MKLIKVVEREEETYEKVTTYNFDGTIKTFCQSFWGNGYRNEEHVYNDKKQITSILIEESDVNHNKEKLLKSYEYNGDDYRVLTYVTHIRNYVDEMSDKSLIYGIDDWLHVDKLICVEEFKFKNNKKIYESYFNIRTNETRQNTFKEEETKAKEIISSNRTSDDGYGSYEELVKHSEGFDLHKYENGLLLKTQEMKTHNGENFLAFETRYTYNTKHELIKSEYFGRGNGEMVLFKVVEETKECNKVEFTVKEAFYLRHYLGYFDIESMMQQIDAHFKEMYYENTLSNTDFDCCIKTVQHLDSAGNVIHSTSTNALTGEFYDRYIHHYEYNNEKQLEFEVSFMQKSEVEPLRMFYIKKCYYA